MSWDIALNSRGTLAGGIVTGDNEILQRLWIRLNRELGEWFINTEVGLPWYQNGYGILGSKPQRKNDIDLLIRREISRTEGIVQILKYNAIYASGTRIYDVYCVVLLRNNRTTEFTFGVSMASQGGTSMPVIPASFIKFDNGKTLQDLYDSGELQGPEGLPGKPGEDGEAATIAVGATTNLVPGSDAYVTNVGDGTHAILNFGIPYGARGEDGIQGPRGPAATITIGTTTTGPAGSAASVENVGTETEAVFDFTIPKGQDGEGASVQVAGGSTIEVTETPVEGGGKLFTLDVIDNAHSHTIDNVTGLQSALDAKLGNLNLTLSGAVTGSVDITGESATLVTDWRSASGINWTATTGQFWFKIASFTTSGTARPNLVMLVSSVSINTNYVLGILRARAYLTPTSASNIAPVWLTVAGNVYEDNNYVLAHNRTGSVNTLELWMRLPSTAAFTGHYVQILQDYDGETGATNQWTLFNNRSYTGAGTIGANMTQYTGFTASIKNRAEEANILATARTITLTGDVSGSTTFNGSANASITTTVNGGLIK